jgi:tetratricopeptide (TPR) repeat protein
MAIQVREKTIEEIKEKLLDINTALNKIGYLESALQVPGFSFEIKRFIWNELAKLYEERKMFERAARALANKAGVEPMVKDKIDSYITAAELYARIGKIDAADDMFLRATRDSREEDKRRVKLARKNVYSVTATELESKGKKASAVKFYEKLIKMNLDEEEKLAIKHKLLDTYNTLGLFREAKLLEGV